MSTCQISSNQKRVIGLKTLLIAAALALTLGISGVAVTALADNSCSNTDVTGYDPTKSNPCIGAVPQNANTVGASSGGSNDLVGNYVNPFIDFLAGAVGLVVTISLVAGGIQYSSSAGDPSKTAAAKKRIVNSVIALFAFLFLYAFLEWLVPGGFLNG